MSASREKKKRQELLSNGSTDPKSAREADQLAADKRANLYYAIGAIAFIVLAIFLVVYNSGIIDRSKTAVTIDGESYNVAETSYYYQQAYQTFINSNNGYYYVALGMLDTNSSLKSQSYDNTRTWDDFFKEQAVDSMQFVHAAKKIAQEKNITLEQEDMDAFNADLDAFKSNAASAGYSYKSYLSAIYGAAMTSSIYEACEKDRILASKVASLQQEEYNFSDGEIQAYYEEHKNNYDLVDGAYVSISGIPETETDNDGNTIEATDEEKTAAMEEAKKTAEEILAAYQDGGDLQELAAQHDVNCIDSEEMSYSSTVYGDWLFDSARTSGNVEVLEDEDNSMYYVVLFNSRKRDEALSYNVRHILVTEENLDLAEGVEAEDGQVEAKAQEILDSWDGTEEGFAKLAEENSQDAGSRDNGGLYEDVAKNDMVSQFNDWCYAAGRKAGDTGIVSTSYGQHIMYFMGYGTTQYWHHACEDAMTNEAFSDWYTETTESVTAEVDDNGMNIIGM